MFSVGLIFPVPDVAAGGVGEYAAAMPEKRDPSLVPLSHDHHHGLVRVFRIRQALLAGKDLEREAVVTCDFFARDLAPHFRAEEEILVPVLRESGAVGAHALSRLVDEHRTLERLVPELSRGVAALRDFADLLERHIRREEREIFPAYELRVLPHRRAEVEAGIRRILEWPDDGAKA
jgi:hemerythrin-like domain-containing protein